MANNAPHVSSPSILTLCDGNIQALQNWPLPSLEESERAETLSLDVKSFRKQYDHVEQRRRSQPPQARFEKDHWEIVRRLAERCRTILARLYDILRDQRSTVLDASLSNSNAEARLLLNAGTCATFRAHLTVHVKVSQLTIHICDLVYLWRQNANQHDLHTTRQTLLLANQELRNHLGHAKYLTNYDLGFFNVGEHGLRTDVTRCIASAENISQVTRIRGFADFQPSKPLSSEAPPPSPAHVVPSNATKTKTTTHHHFEHRPKERQFLDSFEDDQTMLRRSTGSEYSDPEPDFQENLPPAVYTEMIRTQTVEVQRAMAAGEYGKAEKAHLKAIKHLEDREAQLHIPFDNRSQMEETLVDILTKLQLFDPAKAILNNLLKQEKSESNRKWRLYHTLAGIYFAQNRHADAEKFAKRAYIGREKTLGKGHTLISQSAHLLTLIYEKMGDAQTAQAFRNLHPDSSSHSHPTSTPHSPAPTTTSSPPLGSGGMGSGPPQIFKHIGTRRVAWTPDLSVDMNALTKSGKTPLINAIISGDGDFVQQALQNGADLETRCEEGISPLMHCVISGQDKIAGVLLSRGAIVDSLTSGWTPLTKAADQGHGALVELLLENTANIDARSPKKFRPSKKRRHSRHASHASATGPTTISPPDRHTPSPQPSDSDSDASDGGWTPLLRAAEKGQEGMVRLLLDRGANIEASNLTSRTPLACAAEFQHEPVVDLLLTRGADVEAEDEFGWRALHLASFHRGGEGVALSLLNGGSHRDSVGRSSVMSSGSVGGDTLVEGLGGSRGGHSSPPLPSPPTLFPPNLSRPNSFPLPHHFPPKATPNARCRHGKTPLHYAIERDNETMVRVLLSNGADIEGKDYVGRAPLHTAIECRSESMVHLLLESGADCWAKDGEGRDAEKAAERALRRSPEILGLLKRHAKERKRGRKGSVATGGVGGGGEDAGRKGSVGAAGVGSTVGEAMGSPLGRNRSLGGFGFGSKDKDRGRDKIGAGGGDGVDGGVGDAGEGKTRPGRKGSLFSKFGKKGK